MNTQDKVKVIAEYDGWKATDRFHVGYKDWGCLYEKKIVKNRKSLFHFLHDLKYLTSLDWLHLVAMKVLDELDVMISKSKSDYESTGIGAKGYFIRHSCQYKPINGEYIDLFNAVYDGIVFLKSNK